MGSTKPEGEVKARAVSDVLRWDLCFWRSAPPARLVRVVGEAEQERPCWDPKDGELCLSRTKPEETLVEVRSDSDVQIDRQTWV